MGQQTWNQVLPVTYTATGTQLFWLVVKLKA